MPSHVNKHLKPANGSDTTKLITSEATKNSARRVYTRPRVLVDLGMPRFMILVRWRKRSRTGEFCFYGVWFVLLMLAVFGLAKLKDSYKCPDKVDITLPLACEPVYLNHETFEIGMPDGDVACLPPVLYGKPHTSDECKVQGMVLEVGTCYKQVVVYQMRRETELLEVQPNGHKNVKTSRILVDVLRKYTYVCLGPVPPYEYSLTFSLDRMQKVSVVNDYRYTAESRRQLATLESFYDELFVSTQTDRYTGYPINTTEQNNN